MKPGEFFFNDKKHGLIVKKVDNDLWPIGFDEIYGMKWEEKWEYTNRVYQDIINAIDPARVDFIRPVHHVFRVFSNKTPKANRHQKLGLVIRSLTCHQVFCYLFACFERPGRKLSIAYTQSLLCPEKRFSKLQRTHQQIA
jgi:hypothetical protein